MTKIRKFINKFRPWHHFSVWDDCFMPKDCDIIFFLDYSKINELKNWLPIPVLPKNYAGIFLIHHYSGATTVDRIFVHWSMSPTLPRLKYTLQYKRTQETNDMKIIYFEVSYGNKVYKYGKHING